MQSQDRLLISWNREFFRIIITWSIQAGSQRSIKWTGCTETCTVRDQCCLSEGLYYMTSTVIYQGGSMTWALNHTLLRWHTHTRGPYSLFQSKVTLLRWHYCICCISSHLCQMCLQTHDSKLKKTPAFATAKQLKPTTIFFFFFWAELHSFSWQWGAKYTNVSVLS